MRVVQTERYQQLKQSQLWPVKDHRPMFYIETGEPDRNGGVRTWRKITPDNNNEFHMKQVLTQYKKEYPNWMFRLIKMDNGQQSIVG